MKLKGCVLDSGIFGIYSSGLEEEIRIILGIDPAFAIGLKPELCEGYTVFFWTRPCLFSAYCFEITARQFRRASRHYGLWQRFVEVNGIRYTHSIIVMPEGPVRAWPAPSFAALTHACFQDLIQTLSGSAMIELLLFGSGARLRFPSPQLMTPFVERNIALETMDSHAACRTYNILAAEGRRVAAALLVGPDA